MNFNISEMHKNLEAAGAQLRVFLACFKDNSDHEQARIIGSILKTVNDTAKFFTDLEGDDFDDDDE